MDTTSATTSETTCCRCQERFAADTLYPVVSAIMHPSTDRAVLAARISEAPVIAAAICGDCANLLFGTALRRSVRDGDEPSAIRLQIRTNAPSWLVPDGHRPGDTVGFPTGGRR